MLHGDDEAGVRTRRLIVHVGRTDGPVLITLEKELVDLALVSDIDFRDILNVDTLALELADLQVLGRRIDQILDSLHVDLNHRYFHLVLHLWRSIHDLLEDVADHPRDHASLRLIRDIGSKHGVGLATTRLAVGEDGTVEALHDTQHDRLDSLLIDISL